MPGYGALGHLAFSTQNSGGTLSVASPFFIPLISESLVHNIDPLMEGDFTRYKFMEPPVHQGPQTVAGGMEFEPYPECYGQLAKAFFNVASSTITDSCYQHNFYAGQQGDFGNTFALPPQTVEIFRGVGSAFRFQDGQVTEFGISLEPGGFLKGSLSAIGRAMNLSAPLTPVWETTDPFRWDVASISFDGAGFAALESFDLTMANNVEGVPTLGSSFWWGHTKRTGFLEIRLNGNLSFNDADEYVKFAAGSEQAVILNLQGTTEICSGYKHELKIDIPHFRYDSVPIQIGGPGRISVAFTGRAVADTTSLYSIQMTLQNLTQQYL